MAEYGQPAGVQYYLELTIKDTKYNPVNIKSLVIRSFIFNILPTIEITLIDDGYLSEISPLEDGEDIDVVIAKSEDDPNPMSLTFSLFDYTIGILGDNRKSIINLTGILKVKDMFTTKNKCYSKQNSSSVLKSIASDAGLVFSNPHKLVPSDNMTWYNNSLSNFDYIKHVLRRAFIPDDVMFFYADTKKNFVFTSLKSEIGKKNVKKAKFDVRKYESNVKDDNDPDDTVWFTSYSIVNSSGYFNKKTGYGFEYSYYDLENIIDKSYRNISKITELSFRNKDLVGKDKAVDKRYNVDYIEANLYGVEYFESPMRNRFLKNNFFANSLVLNVNALSQINLMDTIDVDIPSLFKEGESNEVQSGEYLVCGVQHEVSSGGIYKKKLALGRNGMNKSPYVKQYKVEVL